MSSIWLKLVKWNIRQKSLQKHANLLLLVAPSSEIIGGDLKGDATTSTIVQESTIFTINVQLSTIIVTVFLIVTIIVDKCT